MEGYRVLPCGVIVEEMLEPLPEVLSRLGHVDIAILTENDGEAVEVFGDAASSLAPSGL